MMEGIVHKNVKSRKALVDDVNVNRLGFRVIGQECYGPLHVILSLRGRKLQHLFDVEIDMGADPLGLHHNSIMDRRIAC